MCCIWNIRAYLHTQYHKNCSNRFFILQCGGLCVCTRLHSVSHYQLLVDLLLLPGLLCGHTDLVMQRLNLRQLPGRLQLRRTNTDKRTEFKRVYAGVNSTSFPRDATYVPVAADLLEPAVLVDERGAVLLPLRGQVDHPLGAGLHQSLQEGAHARHRFRFRFTPSLSIGSKPTWLRPT